MQHLPPLIVPRSRHLISRQQISPNALKVLYRLKESGFAAYLVGGGVRDLLLGREPKDFDVATNARPEQVRSLFRNCRLIGRRFRLAHVRYGREIIEVATFRAPHETSDDDRAAALSEEGRILRDNVYGTFEQDAWRRDFTINALYYDIRDFSVIDYVGGMIDLEAGRVSLIGEPEVRYREDPVRMLRAIRFAAKLGFRINQGTGDPIETLAPLLRDVAPARLFDEMLKLMHGGNAAETFELMRHYDLFRPLFPATHAILREEEGNFPHTFIIRALENTDRRVVENKPVTPAFLFAVLLWEPVRCRARALLSAGVPNELSALQTASAEIVHESLAYVGIPKRFSLPMREIWILQPRFEQRQQSRVRRLLAHPRFRAAYDFYCLRAEVGDADADLCSWWTQLQETDESGQQTMLAARQSSHLRKHRRRRSMKPSPGSVE